MFYRACNLWHVGEFRKGLQGRKSSVKVEKSRPAAQRRRRDRRVLVYTRVTAWGRVQRTHKMLQTYTSRHDTTHWPMLNPIPKPQP